MSKPNIVATLERSARQKRFQLFCRLFANIGRPERPLKILDVGGTFAYWQQMDLAALGNVEIVLLNVTAEENLPHPFQSICGDGRRLAEFSDRQFDIVYSNSTLGHVGNLADQERMAGEIRRVGQRYFVQTPNQYFFIDWRTLVPFFHWFPISMQAWCFRHINVGTYHRIRDHEESVSQARRVRNLTRSEIRKMFPDGQIVRERVGGFTKSFVVYKGFDSSLS